MKNLFNAFLDFVRSSDNPIGKVLHYFWREEYQQRGMIHFHCLFWIEGGPLLGASSQEEIAKFILQYATCKLPNKNISPLLYERVNACQRHKHNDYCLRSKKTKVSVVRVCRFGFPRPVTDTLILRDVQTSISGRRNLKSKSRLYDLPRTKDEVNINDYNPSLLFVFPGNIDFQYVGDKSTALTIYLTKYMLKAEKGSGAETFDKIKSTKSLYSRLWNFGMRMLTHRECGELEAADNLLGHSLYGTDADTVIRWLNVFMTHNRR